MKIRSQKLFAFLKEKGVLEGTDEQIKEAKRAFRKQYKDDWKKFHRLKRREISSLFTSVEYEVIRTEAKRVGLPPATYVRQTILAVISNNPPLVDRQKLLKALQLIGMSNISLSLATTPVSLPIVSEHVEQLSEAEQILLAILNA